MYITLQNQEIRGWIDLPCNKNKLICLRVGYNTTVTTISIYLALDIVFTITEQFLERWLVESYSVYKSTDHCFSVSQVQFFVKKLSRMEMDKVIVKNKFPLSHTLLDHRYDVKIVQNFAINPLTCRVWFHFSFEHLTSFLWTIKVSTMENDKFSPFFNLCICFPVKSKLCWSASGSAGIFKESNGRKEGPSRVGVATLHNNYVIFSK